MARIPVCYAWHNQGCAPTYSIRALERLGHETRRMNPDEYFASNPNEFDLFFCQDSGEGINFNNASPAHLKKTSWWSWDSRFNRVQRHPGDDEMAQLVSRKGGWVFQAQSPDILRCMALGVERMSYLPIAADPDLWCDDPPEEKIYLLSFVGNCYDGGRASAIQVARDRCGLIWPGPNSVFFEDAAKLYRQSWVVFHAPTFYNLPHDVTHERVDFDLTMRPYEALACGCPLVTPPLPDYTRQGFVEGQHIFVYRTLEEVPQAVENAYQYAKDPQHRKALREFIISNHTYQHRIQTALFMLKAAGVYNA